MAYIQSNKQNQKHKQASKVLVSSVIATMIVNPLTQGNVHADNSTPQPVTDNLEASRATVNALTADDILRIPATSITSITSNAGDYNEKSVIQNAIDGKRDTHWETKRPNSDTFKNIVTITFDNTYTLNRLDYLVRQDSPPKGFPLKYNIYYSSTEQDDDFQLLKSGSYKSPSNVDATIEFPATEIRRIQFEFVEVSGNWASISEISFYRPDLLGEQIDQMFTDKTYSKLTPAYQDAAKIDKLIADIGIYSTGEAYRSLLMDAKLLTTNPDAFNDKTITTSQRGNPGREQTRTKMVFSLRAFDMFGYYVSPGETIQLYVDAGSGVTPTLVLGQVGEYKNIYRNYPLKPGINTIQAPTDMLPAALYISNEALPADQEYAPKIRLIGGTKYPLFVHGKTDPIQFVEDLKTYLNNVSYDDNDFRNGNPNGYYYNIAELTSKHALISTSAAGALKAITATPNITVDKTMQTWDDMFYAYSEYSGFDLNDETSENYMPRGKFNARIFSRGSGFMWAQGISTGYNAGTVESNPKRDQSFYVSIASADAVTSAGWGIMHEFGHQFETNSFARSEATNNLFAMMMQDKYLGKNRLSDGFWANTINQYHVDKVHSDSPFFYLAVVYQLEQFYDKDVYAKVSRIARENPDGVLDGLSNNNDRLIVAMSLALGIDVSSHFEYYQEPASEEAKRRISQLPPMDKKVYLWNEQVKSGIAFTNPSVKPVLTATGNKEVTLNIKMDEPATSIASYEIFRDGQLLKVLNGDVNTYVDTDVLPNKRYEYTVRAYDAQLNPSKMSDPVIKNTSEPIIRANSRYTIALNQPFDLLKDVTAVGVDGKDISSSLSVKGKQVDTSKEGTYQVLLSASDADGNETLKTITVNVVKSFDYLSDLDWDSAEVGWDKIQRDKNPSKTQIKLKQDDYEVPYVKGLGTHANSTVVYSVYGKEYDTLETYVGVDQTMKDNNASSVTFEVWVDDVKKYDSGIMRSNTNQYYVNIPIKGARVVKLITTDGKNNNSSDHSVWGDAKFIRGVTEAVYVDRTELTAAVQRAVEIVNQGRKYDNVTWEQFITAKKTAESVLYDTQALQIQLTVAAEELRAAMDNLVSLAANKDELRRVLEYANKITSDDYVITINGNKDELWNIFINARTSARQVEVNAKSSQYEVDQAVDELIEAMRYMGQNYSPGGEPVKIIMTDPGTIPDQGGNPNPDYGSNPSYPGDGTTVTPGMPDTSGPKEENPSDSTKPTPVVASSFSDIKGHWAENAIKRAAELGIVEGYKDGTFKPQGKVTRAEFAQMLAKATKQLPSNASTMTFNDLSEGYWAYGSIQKLHALGFINSSENGTKAFAPDKSITRTELAEWMSGGLTANDPAYMEAFKDLQNTMLPYVETYQGNIPKDKIPNLALMLGTGLMVGDPEGNFHLKETTTRAEVATLLQRYVDIEAKKATDFQALNELREVGKTGTNLLSLSSMRFSSNETGAVNSFDKIRNQEFTLNNQTAKVKFKRIILTDSDKNGHLNGIYSPMFLDSDEITARNSSARGNSFDDYYRAYVEVTVTPLVEDLWEDEITAGLYGNIELQGGLWSKTVEKYGYPAFIKAEDRKGLGGTKFIKDLPTTVWMQADIPKQVGSNTAGFIGISPDVKMEWE